MEKNGYVSRIHKSAENHVWYLIQRHVTPDIIETRELDVWQRSKIPVGLLMMARSHVCNAKRRLAKFIINAEDMASPGIDSSSDVTISAEVSQNRTLPNAIETFKKIKPNFISRMVFCVSAVELCILQYFLYIHI